MSLTKVSGKLLKDNVNVVAGVVTATTISVGSATTLTQDGISAGVVTATTIKVGTGVTINSGIISATTIKVGTGVTINSGIISATNVSVGSSVTAQNFFGSGANLSGIDATSLKDSGGNVKVQANTSGAVVTGIATVNGSIEVGDSFVKEGAIGLGTTSTTGRNAGVGTAIGTLIYNSSTNQIQVYGPAGWNAVSLKTEVTGGTVTTSGDQTIRTFTSTEPLVVSGDPLPVTYLVVGGGGGGNNGGGIGGGGGGAGGMRTGSTSIAVGSYVVTVGGGGAAAIGGVQTGTPGIPSILDGITSQGGGLGRGSGPNPAEPLYVNGGSGGGGNPGGPGGNGNRVVNTNTVATEQGNDGGAQPGDTWEGRGGGGAGGAATSSTGGGGSTSAISGATVTYAAGGGGGRNTWQGGGSAGAAGHPSAGAGGNRTGPNSENPAGDATANRGGGGGGGGRSVGGAGGSGVVIISYPTSSV